MPTNSEEIRINLFAQQCIESLIKVKESLPKSWKEKLAPFKADILKVAEVKKTSNTIALELIISELNKSEKNEEILKIQHIYFLAAYCDLSQIR